MGSAPNPLESGGQDHAGADAYQVVAIAGHGRAALNQLSFPRREVLLSRTEPNSLNARRNCDVVSLDTRWHELAQQHVEVHDTMLGSGEGGVTASIVWATSCSLNDNTWSSFSFNNRVGQEFGFERSPNLYEPDMMELWLADSLTMRNQEAWIVQGMKIMGAKETVSIHAGPVAIANGVSKSEAEDLFRNSSMALGCRVQQKLPANTTWAPQIRWRKGMSPCTANVRCTKPQYCSPNPDGGFPEAVGKHGQPLISAPSRGTAPVGPMMRTSISIPNPSDRDVAIDAVAIASALVPNPTAPFKVDDVVPLIAENRARGTWAFHHIGDGVLVGYKASRAQLRVLNRDVADVRLVGGDILDIGAQEAHDRALDLARQMGMQIMGIDEGAVPDLVLGWRGRPQQDRSLERGMRTLT